MDGPLHAVNPDRPRAVALQKKMDDDDHEVQLIEKAYIKITQGTYPEGASKNEKRVIRRKADTLVVVDGVLHYKKKDGSKVCRQLKVSFVSNSIFF